MRTTVELPPDLLRAAKVSDAERRESLKQLFTRALEQRSADVIWVDEPDALEDTWRLLSAGGRTPREA